MLGPGLESDRTVGAGLESDRAVGVGVFLNSSGNET